MQETMRISMVLGLKANTGRANSWHATQQLPQHFPSPLVQEVFKLAGGQLCRGGIGELGGQR